MVAIRTLRTTRHNGARIFKSTSREEHVNLATHALAAQRRAFMHQLAILVHARARDQPTRQLNRVLGCAL
jgi:hypothetical protein